jgi:hypothetical protein
MFSARGGTSRAERRNAVAKYYEVYKRASIYRLARPGMLFWHWHTVPDFGDFVLYQTTNREDAFAECARVNNALKEELEIQKNRWRWAGFE